MTKTNISLNHIDYIKSTKHGIVAGNTLIFRQLKVSANVSFVIWYIFYKEFEITNFVAIKFYILDYWYVDVSESS